MERKLTPLVDHTLDQFDEDGVQTVFAISPLGATETRAERIARWEQMGMIDPICDYCRPYYLHPTLNHFGPNHRASSRCRSGSHPHCTCDTCF